MHSFHRLGFVSDEHGRAISGSVLLQSEKYTATVVETGAVQMQSNSDFCELFCGGVVFCPPNYSANDFSRKGKPGRIDQIIS